MSSYASAGWVPPDDRDDEVSFWEGLREEAEQQAHAGVPQLRGDGGRRDWFALTRAQANSVVCRDCQQPAGAPCIEVGSTPPRVLRRFPAHIHRIADGGGPR